MLRVPSEEFERCFGRYQKAALAQPVAITCDGREQTVIMSAEEYYRLKRRDRQVLNLEDFTQADIDALEKTRAPDASKVFDGEHGRAKSRASSTELCLMGCSRRYG